LAVEALAGQLDVGLRSHGAASLPFKLRGNMSLKVIGAGFGRTGTASLKVALEALGFGPCYHMQEVIQSSKRIEQWHQVGHGQPVDWDTIFEGYQATVDYPAASYYQELLQCYPDAKVILTVRDPDRWYDSTLNTIYNIQKVLPYWLMPLPTVRQYLEMGNAIIWHGIFHGRLTERQYAIDTFNRHIAAVKQHVPADRLLIYEVREGWEPLARFLDVPVPAGKPFTHINDRVMFENGLRILRFIDWGVPMLLSGSVLFALYRILSRRRR
jgi:hypothetical protein